MRVTLWGGGRLLCRESCGCGGADGLRDPSGVVECAGLSGRLPRVHKPLPDVWVGLGPDTDTSPRGREGVLCRTEDRVVSFGPHPYRVTCWGGGFGPDSAGRVFGSSPCPHTTEGLVARGPGYRSGGSDPRGGVLTDVGRTDTPGDWVHSDTHPLLPRDHGGLTSVGYVLLR